MDKTMDFKSVDFTFSELCTLSWIMKHYEPITELEYEMIKLNSIQEKIERKLFEYKQGAKQITQSDDNVDSQ